MDEVGSEEDRVLLIRSDLRAQFEMQVGCFANASGAEGLTTKVGLVGFAALVL